MFLVPQLLATVSSLALTGPVAVASQDFLSTAGDWTTVSTLPAPSDLSVSRAGNAMMYDSTGKLTFAPNNLLLNSATLSTQSVTVAVASYILSIKGTGSVALSGAFTGNLAGTGVANRVDLKFTAAAGSLTLTVTGSVTDARLSIVTYETSFRSVDDVNTTASAYYGLRNDYNPATLAAKGVLIEGSRTNLHLQSGNPISSYTNNTGVSMAAGGSPASDGVSAYTRMTAAAGNTAHNAQINPAFTTTVGQAYAISYEVQYTNNRWIGISCFDGAGIGGATFDIQNGVVGTTLGGFLSSKIIPLGGGKYRISAVRIAASTAFYPQLALLNADAPFIFTSAWNALGTETVDFTFCQMEAGAFATSYIPTTTATVTRAGETLNLANYQNRLIEEFYIDEQTGNTYRSSSGPSATSPLAIFTGNGWVTSFRAYNSGAPGTLATPAWLDVSGIIGNRMMYDSTGTLTYAPNNLLPQSNTFSSGTWTKDNVTLAQNVTDYLGNANSAWTMTDNATNGMHRVYQTDSNQSASAVFSVVAKAGTANFLGLQLQGGAYTVFDLSTGTITATNLLNGVITSLGNGWYRCTVRYSAPWQYTIIVMGTTETQAGSGSYVGSGSTILISDAVKSYTTYETAPRAADFVRTGASQYFGPRFDFDPNTLAARGLLIEESRTNITPFSNALSNAAWTSTNVTPTAAGGTGPDGVTNSMWLITEGGAGVSHTFFDTTAPTIPAGSTISRSFYMAAGTRRYIQATVNLFANGFGVVIDATTMSIVATGAVGGSTYSSSSITNVGNGIYRVTITGVVNGSTTAYSAFCAVDSAAYVSAAPVNAAGGLTWKLYGLQTEVAAFATSYIPTTTASVTRVADIIKLSGTALATLQGSAGSLVEEVTVSLPISANAVWMSDQTNFPLYTFNSDSNVYSWNGSAALASGQSVSSGIPVRGAIGWDAGPNRAISVKGSSAVSAATTFGTIGATVYVGGKNNANYINGYVRGMSIYNQRLSNADLQAKSVVGSAY